MYKLLLTFRYLRRKLIPVFAMLAVVLCTAMVIVVSSVMGGFLDLMRTTGRTLMGDVSVFTGGLEGVPRYDAIIAELEMLPEVESASPVVIGYGLVTLPWGESMTKPVQVFGIRGPDYARTTGYRESLHWTSERAADHPRVREIFRGIDPVETGVQMRTPWSAASEVPPIVPGIEVSPYNRRDKDGQYVPLAPMPGEQLVVTVVPLTSRGVIEMERFNAATRPFIVINEVHSGYIEADAHRVFIPFDAAQEMMNLGPSTRVLRDPDGNIVIDPATGLAKAGGEIPARTTEIHVKGAPGVTLEQLKAVVERAYFNVRAGHDDLPSGVFVRSWEERQAMFLGAVENEKGLVTMLFAIISVVAVVMIGVVFYMIVLEKTRDIGILRAIGASPAGVSSIFLSFGAVVGTLGATIGTVVAVLIVRYINEIHDWLGEGFGQAVFWFGLTQLAVIVGGLIGLGLDLRRGKRLPDTMPGIGVILTVMLTWPVMWLLMLLLRVRPRMRELIGMFAGTAIGLGGAWIALWSVEGLAERLNANMGFQIWDKSIYLFDEIPNTVDPFEITVIVIIAIVASIIGALIPGVAAAMVDPIESLRYE